MNLRLGPVPLPVILNIVPVVLPVPVLEVLVPVIPVRDPAVVEQFPATVPVVEVIAVVGDLVMEVIVPNRVSAHQNRLIS